ncbi:hypothetical protein [Kamptonema formosum]|nr:hypothetical protein [Oscillatoria sp. PCC 10802]
MTGLLQLGENFQLSFQLSVLGGAGACRCGKFTPASPQLHNWLVK